jgi:hypothetical protein
MLGGSLHWASLKLSHIRRGVVNCQFGARGAEGQPGVIWFWVRRFFATDLRRVPLRGSEWREVFSAVTTPATSLATSLAFQIHSPPLEQRLGFGKK